MYVARFSYDLLPKNRERAIDMIRREVSAAQEAGKDARLLVPLLHRHDLGNTLTAQFLDEGKRRHREFACAVGEMGRAEFTAFLRTAMTHAYRWSLPGSVHYWAMDWRHTAEISNAALAVFQRYLNLAVWVKNQPGMGSFLRSQFELFIIFAKGGAPSRNNVQLGRFGRSRSNVWTYPGAARRMTAASFGKI